MATSVQRKTQPSLMVPDVQIFLNKRHARKGEEKWELSMGSFHRQSIPSWVYLTLGTTQPQCTQWQTFDWNPSETWNIPLPRINTWDKEALCHAGWRTSKWLISIPGSSYPSPQRHSITWRVLIFSPQSHPQQCKEMVSATYTSRSIHRWMDL